MATLVLSDRDMTKEGNKKNISLYKVKNNCGNDGYIKYYTYHMYNN